MPRNCLTDVGVPTPTNRTALYRCFRADGSLLYVGISGHPPTRFGHHRARSPWWYLVDESRTTIEWFRTRSRALTWERRAIRTEHPEMNKRDKVEIGGAA